MKIVVALVLLVLGSIVFHWLSPWWLTPLAADWGEIDLTIDITLYIQRLCLSRLTSSSPTASIAFATAPIDARNTNQKTRSSKAG